MQEFVTHSREETVAVGRELAKTLPAGALIALSPASGARTARSCWIWKIPSASTLNGWTRRRGRSRLGKASAAAARLRRHEGMPPYALTLCHS